MKNDQPLKITFTEAAIQDLDQIESFVTRLFSQSGAYDVIKAITTRIEQLTYLPFASKKDLSVRDSGIDLRYVLVKQARIQFEIKGEDIIIWRIQDARQHPDSF